MDISKEQLRKIQLLELNILKEIKRICEQENIKYFLIGGSLIGAIRHNGFIPWDDDIDIAMMRQDFDRFLQVAPKLISKDFFIQTPKTELTCTDYGIARIRLNGTSFVQESNKNVNMNHGFFVDVFPFDNLPDNKISAFFYGSWFPILKRVNAIRNGYTPAPKSKKNKVVLKFFNCLLKPIPTQKLQKWLENYHTKYQNKKTQYSFLLTGSWGYKKEKHSNNLLELPTIMHQFEDDVFSIPQEYHQYLSEQYGDYMQLPKDIESCYNRHKCVSLDFGPYI